MNKLRCYIVFMLVLFQGVIGLSQSKSQLKKAEKFVVGIQAKKYDKVHKYFADTLKNLMPATELSRAMESLEVQYGKIDSIVHLKTYANEGMAVFTYKMYYHDEKALLLNLTLSAKNEISGIYFRPTKVKVSYLEPKLYGHVAYKERKIPLSTVHGELNGVLTLPAAGEKKHPVVIFVHGSGPNDMDGTLYNSKIFYDLTLGLLDSGIASYRYDKRTFTYGARFSDTSTLYSETIEDALNAVEMLKKQPGIDSNQIYVLGHSLGGFSAPRIGLWSKDVAGLIMLGAPCRPLWQIIPLQYAYLKENSNQGITEEYVALQVAMSNKIHNNDYSDTTSSKELMGLSAAYWDYLKRYDILETLDRLSLPVLIMQGERDYQVNLKELDCFKEILNRKSNVNSTVVKGANHLFQYGTGISTPEEYKKPGNVDPEVIKQISQWINAIRR